MNDFSFDSEGYVKLPTKYHGEVVLSRWKWDLICAKPERRWYRFNTEKIPTTLIAPDRVRLHHLYDGQVIYYKRFGQYKLDEKTEIPAVLINKFKFFAVIVDTKTKKVCTIYPVREPKKGKEFKVEGVERCKE